MTIGVRPAVATTERIAPQLELVYDCDCPNVGRSRVALRSALIEFGARPSWVEWDRSSADTPTAYRGFGSPTVLINGRDMHALPSGLEAEANACRLYINDDGSLSGVPSVKSIVRALNDAANAGSDHAA